MKPYNQRKHNYSKSFVSTDEMIQTNQTIQDIANLVKEHTNNARLLKFVSKLEFCSQGELELITKIVVLPRGGDSDV